jgi:hypothetical protein
MPQVLHGQSIQIIWTTKGTMDKVTVQYQYAAGSWIDIATDVNAGAGSLGWHIPDHLSKTCKVKIFSQQDSTVYVESLNNFTIRGELSVTSPAAGAIWRVDGTGTINWTRVHGNIQYVNIDYSTNGIGGPFTHGIATDIVASLGTYNCAVDNAIGNNVVVRVYDRDNTDVYALTVPFSIKSLLTLTRPVGGERFAYNTSEAITWNYTGTIATVKLEYTTNGTDFVTVTGGAAVNATLKTFPWPVPNVLASTLKVRISNNADPADVKDMSPLPFKIVGTLTMISPGGGEVWPVGSSQAITWSTGGSNIDKVNLYYSIDRGVSFDQTIDTNVTASLGAKSFTVPDTLSQFVVAMVIDKDEDSVFAKSSTVNFIKIRGDLVVTRPAMNDVFLLDSSEDIQWTRFGNITAVNIQYSPSGGSAGSWLSVQNGVVHVPGASQHYTWPSVPNPPTLQAMIRVADATDPTVFDDSPLFIIRGGFRITQPNDGTERWAVGSEQTIKWMTFGSYANVKLSLSKTGVTGPFDTTIIAFTGNGGEYKWLSVTDAISDNCYVRIMDVVDSDAMDICDNAFKIHGVLAITSPLAGDKCGVGTTKAISWTKTGTISNIKLEYSTNAFADGSQIYTINNGNDVGGTSFPWSILNTISNEVKVRASVSTDPSVNAFSGTFKIHGTLTALVPNGAQTWIAGSAHPITWFTQGSVAKVKIEFCSNYGAGDSWDTVIDNLDNVNSHSWTVPQVISNKCRIRVSNASDPDATVMSAANFNVRGDLTITSPNGGEKWEVGTAHLIEWNTIGPIQKINLEYSNNNGGRYIPIIAELGNTGKHNWSIPDDLTKEALVKIFDFQDSTVVDVSNAVFKIQGSIRVTSPNGGEAWDAATTKNVTWTSQGNFGYVDLFYSKDSGSAGSWVNIATSRPNILAYEWPVPVDAVSTKCRVKIADSADEEAFDTSNNDFRVQCRFVLTAPTSASKWRVARTYNITWNKVGNPAAVKLEYSQDDFLDPMMTVVINAAASPISPYPWQIPNYIYDTVEVRISDADNAGAQDVSEPFEIIGDVRVISPNGGENWAYDSMQTISWTSAGTVDNVKIYYTYDGAEYHLIKGMGNVGTTTWQIPDHVSDVCRVKIVDAIEDLADDVSDGPFNIVPTYVLTAPNTGSEVWIVDETHPITWTCDATVQNVRLDFATDGQTFDHVITASTLNDGSYDWKVTDFISDTVKVRVGSALSPAAFDASNSNFKIKGKIEVTSPNGGELWQISQLKTITWHTTGTVGRVTVSYSINGSGGAFVPVVGGTNIQNNESLAWAVPDNRTPNAVIRVENFNDLAVVDESNAGFRIQGFVSLNSPNGGENWLAGDHHPISWNWGGTMAAVKLSYTTDGTNYTIINASAPNGAGTNGTHTYDWEVPQTLSHTCKVKVEDTADDTVFDASDADFRINGQIVVTAPAGGERWVTNETRKVEWTTRGTIEHVKLQYSKDGGAPILISASEDNVNSYDWKIPDDRSNSVTVTVSDASDGTIAGTSSGSFKIDYYKITYVVLDLLTLSPLTNLSVSQKMTYDPYTVVWTAKSLTSPVDKETPFGDWTTTWSLDGYTDKGQKFKADSDQTFTIFLETTAVHIWRSEGAFTYDPDSKKLNITAWLERDGSLVPGVTALYISVYDQAGVLMNPFSLTKPVKQVDNSILYVPCTLKSEVVPSDGYFRLEWANPGLVAGKMYSVLVDIRNASGAPFVTPTSFNITETQRLADTQAAVETMGTVTLPAFQESVSNTLTLKMNEQIDLLAGSTAENREAKRAEILATGGMVGMIQKSLTTFETSSNAAIVRLQSGADTAIAAGQELEATAKKYSWGATLAPDPALAGDTITLQVQGQPGKMPFVSIYSWDNNILHGNQMMLETRPGFYVFSFTADNRFQAGKAYTYMATESTTGGLVSGSGMVESMSISTVAGLAAAAPEAERAAKKALDAIKAVEAVLVSKDNVNIALTLQNLKSSVDALPDVLNKEGPDSKLFNAVNDISEKLKALMGDEGVDIGAMLEEKLGGGATIKDMRKKTESISSIVDLLLQIMEAKLGGVDTPIISTSLTSGSVKFRIMVVNPSKTKVQKVQVKKYLPQEVKLKDIMDAGGLDLEYDSEKAIYYAYKNDLELQTGEARVFDVEVEDIWIIPDATFADVRKQVESAAARLKNSDFAARAEELAKTVPGLIDEMQKSQADEGVSREQHIGLYRQNLQTIKKIQEELAQMQRSIQQSSGPQTPDVFEKNKLKLNMPAKTTTWLIIIVIIVFLGLLAGIFFFGWLAQMKSSQGSMDAQRKDAFPPAGDKKPEVKK